MASLRVVKFGYNNLNGNLPNDFFSQLPQLENFTLYNNQFVGIIPGSIDNCTSLIYLALHSNFLTGMFYFSISTYLPEIGCMLIISY